MSLRACARLAAGTLLAIVLAGSCGTVSTSGGDAAAGASGQGGRGGSSAGGAGGGAGAVGCGPGYPVGSSRPAGDGCNSCSCIAPGTWVCSTAACPIGGGGGGGAAGAEGGRGGGGGAGGCAPNQVWCPGCEPGTGACYVGGCPGVACPPPDGGAGGAAGARGGSGGAGGRGGSTGAGGASGAGGRGGSSGAALCGARACTSSEICVRPSCGGTAPQCIAVPDGGQCPTGWTYRSFCNTFPTPGPGCEEPPCTPPPPYCLTRPAACGATITCSCLPANVCQGGGSCSLISNGEALCASA